MSPSCGYYTSKGYTLYCHTSFAFVVLLVTPPDYSHARVLTDNKDQQTYQPRRKIQRLLFFTVYQFCDADARKLSLHLIYNAIRGHTSLDTTSSQPRQNNIPRPRSTKGG